MNEDDGLSLFEYSQYARSCGEEGVGLIDRDYWEWYGRVSPTLKGLDELQELEKEGFLENLEKDEILVSQAREAHKGFQAFYFESLVGRGGDMRATQVHFDCIKRTLISYDKSLGVLDAHLGDDKSLQEMLDYRHQLKAELTNAN